MAIFTNIKYILACAKDRLVFGVRCSVFGIHLFLMLNIWHFIFRRLSAWYACPVQCPFFLTSIYILYIYTKIQIVLQFDCFTEQQGHRPDGLSGLHDWHMVLSLLAPGGPGGRGPGAPPQEFFQHSSAHFQPQDEHLVLHLYSLLVGLMGEAQTQVLLLKSFFNILPPTSNLRMST